MTFSAWFFRGALAVLLGAGLNGCVPSSQSQREEEKEAHYLAGKNCINTIDYKSAVEEFEKALEVNPHSAAAHFELGWLFEEKEPDPAAAIYHYEQSLKLNPNIENAEWVKQRITNCKQDLAKTVLPLPITPGMQHQFEQLADENKRLREENEKWKAYFASRSQAPTNPPVVTPVPVRAVPLSSSTQPTNPAPPDPSPEAHPPAGGRTHTVQSGELLYSIAKKYSVKLDALLAANPGVDPRRLRVGQTLNIPSP